jgi:alcohol dehydrogenase
VEIGNFSVARLPQILFGQGCLQELPDRILSYGRRLLIVTGKRSFTATACWPALQTKLKKQGISWEIVHVAGEPSPQLVDDNVARYRSEGIEVVAAIGGGSVLDAAKAIAGLLPHGNSVVDHLEGVGNDIPYHGPATPFIAVPTTAGTGSEATKNAVLSVYGEQGYKKSFRHDALVPAVAVVDPALLAGCPPDLIAANGMDALTQCLESYVSLRANPFTDALAWSGLKAVKRGLFAAWRGGNDADAKQGRACMAYGALLSGITLAQAGLGSVHGLASPLGAYFPIPHGVACGTLVAAATDKNIRALRSRDTSNPALEKYAAVGRMLADSPELSRERAWTALVETLNDWTEKLEIPLLSAFGMGSAGVNKVVAGSRGSSMKTNPIVLTDDEILEMVTARL